MYNNICTSWQDVREWIEDNKLQRYTFRASRSQDGQRQNDTIFAYCSDDTPEDNLRLCEKRLQNASGCHLYGTGFRSANANTGGVCVEVQYSGAQMQPAYGGVGSALPIDEDSIKDKIRRELKMEMELETLKRREKEIQEKEKAYEEEKSSVVGQVISYLAPYIAQVAGAKRMAAVAGAGGPVVADRIVPQDQEEETADPNDFPDEEASEVYELIKRFRKIEPDYLEMLRSVVDMAERGDQMYAMAKGFLVKK